MNILNLNSLAFRSEDQNFRITTSWNKDILPNLISSQDIKVTEIRIYELDSEQLEFAKKYHLPFKHTYYSLDEINKFILLLEEYEELIIELEELELHWDFTSFDFEGLKEAINQEMDRRNKNNTSDSTE